MKTFILILLMAFVASTAVYGRQITGKVVGENDSPLDFVNVVLYRDSTYITGTVTDQAGMFSIPADASGNLSARISFVGYETSRLPVPASGNLGTIRLAAARRNSGKWWSALRGLPRR